MCSAGESREIIILSDDDEEEEDSEKDSENNQSCLIIEDEKITDEFLHSDSPVLPSASDEDLVVTFSRRADVLPHARYDCPIHPFTAADCETAAPLTSNQLICDQCFCYICDKLASSCAMWTCSGQCHCNGHKKSEFWNNLRNNFLLGELKMFNLSLSEIDSHLRHAEIMLQNFRKEVSTVFSSFILGKIIQQNSQQHEVIHDYMPVFNFVTSFLNQADKQNIRAAALMNLGAAEVFMKHFQVPGPTGPSPLSNASNAKLVLLQRVIRSMQRLVVVANLPPGFVQKLQNFYQTAIHFPADIKSMKNSLSIRSWDDVLLVSVLKGQNVSGVRKDKGKKTHLAEEMSVVLLRSELLQHQRRYRELCRYLKVVQTDDSARFQKLQDLIPFFLCMQGDLTEAMTSLFPSVNAPACRFSPLLFLVYLRIFQTATAPKLVVSQPEQLSCPNAVWESIKDAAPLKCVELVKFALKAQRCSAAVYTDSHCWTSLLTIVNSSTAFPQPSPEFLHESRHVVKSVLFDHQNSNVTIPRSFYEVYPHQALLLLVSGALSFRILNGALCPALPVINTFKDNMWAFRWMFENLSVSKERVQSFYQEVTQEVTNSTGSPLAFNLIPS
ncbi:hypothetical protein FQA47_009129 [Oryzias melastigma]|uniref:Uncharacterized LOC112137202 n=1 Tax=Oryzias melastigma TaxID=30732 RepID=A0A3B3DVU6_ORYME|nr:uncharacterized protein zgc:112980 [Oryzias melastigma]KAF6736360.1 hypothetical protein FQA47_009129 [Oryzias melastigma]